MQAYGGSLTHTHEEWEAIRGAFTRQYYHERQTLRNVQETLASEYGFRATYVVVVLLPRCFSSAAPGPKCIRDVSANGVLTRRKR